MRKRTPQQDRSPGAPARGKPRRVALVAFEGFQLLDIAGPLEVFSKANREKPKQVKVLVNLGVALDNLGRPGEAQDYYKQAITLAPTDSLASCRLATSLYAQGKHGEAMTQLRTLIAKQPRSYCAYFTMGVAFADAGLYRDAIRMWKKVVEIAPASPEAQSAKESIDVLERFLAGS